MKSTHTLKNKDIQTLLNCSKNYATKIRKDIKETYAVKVPLKVHFDSYFNVKCEIKD